MKLTIESHQPVFNREFEKKLQANFEYLGRVHDGIAQCNIVFIRCRSKQEKEFSIEVQLLVTKKLLQYGAASESFDAALYRVLNGLEHQLYCNRIES